MKWLLVLWCCPVFSCNFGNTQLKESENKNDSTLVLMENEKAHILMNRFKIPVNCIRAKTDSTSYAYFLQHLKLKPKGEEVAYFNGDFKPNYQVYSAVVDLPIGHKNLHQCADAIMRLRADYLWSTKQEDKIHFNFTNGFRVDYKRWKNGERVKLKGNKSYWVTQTTYSNSYQTYWKYLETIFTYAGTLSLSKELQNVVVKNMKIGDVFIVGGSPGHAVTVVDMATDSFTSKKYFMLAQSYMPAQEIQILLNPNSEFNSSWYPLDFDNELETPEWTFMASDLKRF